MPLSLSYDHKVLDLIFGGQALPALATLYVGVSTTAPAKNGTGVTEPVGGSYARVAVTNDLANWPAAVAGAKANGTLIQFPEPTAPWGTITHLVIYDAAVAGNLVAYATLGAARTLNSGSNVNFPIGDLTATLV
jgi:hypothetical protein